MVRFSAEDLPSEMRQPVELEIIGKHFFVLRRVDASHTLSGFLTNDFLKVCFNLLNL